jgi:hypothetical protein
MHSPVFKFHILIVLSMKQLINSKLSVDLNPNIEPVCPSNVLMQSPVDIFHILRKFALSSKNCT